MLIYNVLFKGVEVNQQFCRAFASYQQAESYIDSFLEENSSTYTCKSTSGWISYLREYNYDENLNPVRTDLGDPELIVDNFTDYRLEDKDGNSYYFVVFVQEINPEN
jgi:hypothetical protein